MNWFKRLQCNAMIDTLIHLTGNERACLWVEPLQGIPYNCICQAVQNVTGLFWPPLVTDKLGIAEENLSVFMTVKQLLMLVMPQGAYGLVVVYGCWRRLRWRFSRR